MLCGAERKDRLGWSVIPMQSALSGKSDGEREKAFWACDLIFVEGNVGELSVKVQWRRN